MTEEKRKRKYFHINKQQRKKKSLGVSSTVFKVIIFRLCQSNIFIITTATTTKLEERYQNRQLRPVDLIHIKTKLKKKLDQKKISQTSVFHV